eukprot:500490_1
MFTTASKDNTQNNMTKSLLKTIHDQQLTNGLSNNKNKEAIISLLGGVDELLSNLFQSNFNFNDKQLQSLHHIITHPNNDYQTNMINKIDNSIEDKGYKRKLKFTFNDNDILLYKIFAQQTATTIINILNSKIIKILLVLMVFTGNILVTLSVSQHVFYTYQGFITLIFSIYLFGWILYCNKLAMNMLFKEFEFWF